MRDDNYEWQCESCHWVNKGVYSRKRGTQPAPTWCQKCGRDRPPVTRQERTCRVVFCDKKGCSCTYLNFCPTHGAPAEPETPCESSDESSEHYIY